MNRFLKITAVGLMLISFGIGISTEVTELLLPKPVLVFMAFVYFLLAIFIFIKLKNK